MTIREITKLTGISSATICKAFKDPRSVKAQTWSILEPFYAKNSSSPSKSSLGEVHIIIPNITNSFFSDIVSSIVDHLYKYHIAPILHFTDDNTKKELEILNSIPNNYKTGIVWLPSSHVQIPALPQKLNQRIILIDRDIDHPDIKVKVLLDNYELAKEAVSLLIKEGNKNPAFINGALDTYTAKERARGVEDVFNAQNLSGERIFYGEFSDESLDYQLCQKILEKKYYDCFILGNQTISYSFLRAIKHLKLRIPEDIRCIAFDFLPQRDLLSFPLSIISLPARKIGLQASKLLLNYNPLSSTKTTLFIESTIYLHGSEQVIL